MKQNDGVTRLEHHQKLSDIHFDFDLQLYCPQGNEHYTAQMSVDMVPDKYLPDYIELDKEFRHGCGKDLIIEDACGVGVQPHPEQICPGKVKSGGRGQKRRTLRRESRQGKRGLLGMNKKVTLRNERYSFLQVLADRYLGGLPAYQ